MGPKLRWLGIRVIVHLQPVWPCYALLLEFLGPCDLFTPVLQEALLLTPPLEAWQVLFFVSAPLDMVSGVVVVIWGGYLYVNGDLTWFGPADTSCIPQRHTLCMLVDFGPTYFGIMLNDSTITLNASQWYDLLLQMVILAQAFLMIQLNLVLIA